MKYQIKHVTDESGKAVYSIDAPHLKAKNLTMEQVWKLIQTIEGKDVMQCSEEI